MARISAWIVSILIGASIPLAVMWSIDVWGVTEVTYDINHWLATAILLVVLYLFTREEI